MERAARVSVSPPAWVATSSGSGSTVVTAEVRDDPTTTVPATVSSTVAHRSERPAPGTVTSMSSWWALRTTRNESSTTRWPRWSDSGMPSPLRNTVTTAAPPSQSSSPISSPAEVNQAMSRCGSSDEPGAAGRISRPLKKRRRRNTGCAARSADTAEV